MKINDVKKKLFFVVTISILLLGLFTNVNAELKTYNEDGVAFDNFSDDQSVILDTCELKNGHIRLQSGNFTSIYDYSKTKENVFAWEYERSIPNPIGNLSRIFSLYISPKILPTKEFDNIDAISKRDNICELTISEKWRLLDHTSYPMALFKFKFNEKVADMDQIYVTWYSGKYDATANVESISMYLWRAVGIIPRWQAIAHLPYTPENINEPNGFIFTAESAKNYVSKDGELYILIVATPKSKTGEEQSKLYSDYIKVEVIINEGYLPQGSVISQPIDTSKSTLHGWESVFWEGSRPSSTTSIKIQVLDEAGALITALAGNSEGFTSSPIDLSKLSTNYKKIRLKATFSTTALKYSPRLYSWGVLWQTKPGFYDSFNHDFRIDDIYGLNIESGKVKISDFYSDWEIFGNNPQNTRSYFGSAVKLGQNKTYWHTDVDEDIGGWFRSPVVSNGKVYIASNDNRIYSYNLTFESEYPEDKNQAPFDKSKAEYFVESSLAVSDDKVIVATSKLNSNQNRIYALNSSNLSEEIWRYPPTGEDETICFSAAPTIANNRVFITSWSGLSGNIPRIEYLLSKIDNLIRSFLGTTILGFKNNKLIVLDLESGTPIWDPINLPASSFCTPAIDNGLIYVGFRNIQGPSLIAYNENTGEEVWNATLGRIDRASPVIAQGESKKIVIAVSRNQSYTSYQGEDIVTALSAETGEILWNMTISNQSSISRTLLKLSNFSNIIAIDGSAATPAVSGNIVYIVSPNGSLYALDINTGKPVWTLDIKSKAGGILPPYYTSSPVVVDDVLYIASQNAKLYALDAINGNIKLEYFIRYEGFVYDIPLQVYSSLVVTDGLILISTLEPSEKIGHLICLGDYTKNSIGRIYSIPIHIQKGKWWSKFYVDYTGNTTENTIRFSILDLDGNVLLGNLYNKTVDLSGKIPTESIQLYAEIKIANFSQSLPVLNSWEIELKTEDTAPKFDENSFKPDPSGWIRNNTPICSIEVKDTFPGLNPDSAKFRLTYITGNVSNWFTAQCTGKKGSIVNETITADVSKVNIGTNKLKLIEFSIEDLCGNMATFKLGSEFKIDSIKPESWTVGTFNESYNKPVQIIANGTDPGDIKNSSGIDTISIYYRLKEDKDWIFYTSAKSHFYFYFEKNISGVYEICTIAQDRAGNVEDFPTTAAAFFILDVNPPNKPVWDEEENSAFNWVPKFTVDFSDDYKLKKVEYRLSNQANWVTIKDNIGSADYTGIWEITDEEWAILEEGITYYVYFRVTDSVDNIYETPSFEEALYFSIDTIPPGTAVFIDVSDFEKGGKDKYTIIADVPLDDEIKYVSLEYSYSNDNDKWRTWKQFGEKLEEEPYEWEFKPQEGSGYYKFKVLIWDAHGNSNESPVKNVTYTLFPAGYLSLLIILFIVLFLISLIVLRRLRAK
jgi:outer membrane protein assembly factor BamB